MSDDFSQKEILLQLLSDLRKVSSDLSDQKVLLQTHINSSIDRDRRMADLKMEVDNLKEKAEDIKKELDNLSSNFRFFRFKVTMIAGAIATIASLAGQRLLEYVF